jgi:hypothetical protein
MAQKKKAKGMTKLIQLPSCARRAVEIGRAIWGRYSRSFGLSASLASPPFGE